MTELAFDEYGVPFEVPPHVWGWRVKRAADGRGRPAIVYDKGKPLFVRVNATHAELLALAGPGRYRLDPIDERRQTVEDVPIALTGPLTNDAGASVDDTYANDVVIKRPRTGHVRGLFAFGLVRARARDRPDAGRPRTERPRPLRVRGRCRHGAPLRRLLRTPHHHSPSARRRGIRKHPP